MKRLSTKSSLMGASVLLAASQQDVPTSVTPVPPTNITIQQIITNIILYILGFSAALAVLFIIIGGIRYITSAGNADAAANARNIILYSVIGLLVIILSFVIVTFTQNLAPVIVP